jgi:CspA family cold shock protein
MATRKSAVAKCHCTKNNEYQFLNKENMLKRIINKLMNTNKVTIMKEGTVKFFNTAKGFGFITVKDSNEEVFVHSTNLLDDIRENDEVKFDVERGDKGLSAIKVSLI